MPKSTIKPKPKASRKVPDAITLLDVFAGCAMQAILPTAENTESRINLQVFADDYARVAYAIALAMRNRGERSQS